MTKPEDLPYTIQDRELIGEVNGLRVQIMELGPGECVPWHWHSVVDDTFVCMEGPMIVETRAPRQTHELMPGDRLTVPVKTAHEVHGKDGAGCKFMLVQGIGEHDFHPVG
ncbi:MAG: cupin domain-containing protein [Rhodospirillales bacterium]